MQAATFMRKDKGGNMLKLFVTGDNHIGLKYASHERASVLAAKRAEAFSEMVEKANDEDCDLFIITGDLFENTYSTPKKDIASLCDTLSAFRGTVAVLPGNHDYYDKEVKVWQYFIDCISMKDNIMLLSEYRPYELSLNIGDVVLYPALCTSLHSAPGENNLGWIKDEGIIPDAKYRIGIAHGAVEGETIDSEGAYFLMKRSELEAIPVDCWLIGHTHVPFPKGLTLEFAVTERILNAGTHVQTDVNCNTEGLCFIVEIDENKTVRAKKFISGGLRFYRREIVLSAGRVAELIDSSLEGIGDQSVVELILKGAVSAEEYDALPRTVEEKLSRFIEGKYNDYSVTRLISEELIDSEFPETSLSAKLLKALLEEPKEAQLTYELLNSLKGGGKA